MALSDESCYEIDYAGLHHFACSPEEVWSALEDADRVETWWWWLRGLQVEGEAVSTGSVWHGVIATPVGYRMRVDVELTRCEEPYLIDANVGGDLDGTASLRLEPAADGARVQVAWRFEMKQWQMRAAARVAYPVLRWGHDQVVHAAVTGFGRHISRLSAEGQGNP